MAISKIFNIVDIANIVSMPNFDPLGIFNPIPPPQFPGKKENGLNIISDNIECD